MRIIGHLGGEAKARTFSDYLLVQGIDNQVETEKNDSWAVWIHAEEELERAKGLLTLYQQNPDDPKFQSLARGAAELRERRKEEQARYEKKVKTQEQLFHSLASQGFGTVTLTLICASVVVFLLSRFGPDPRVIRALFISQFDYSNLQNALPEVRRGEIWRLVTPIFIHFGFVHIFFNMLWLRDLGSMIEARQGGWQLTILVLVIAVVSNLAQYFMSGPDFGGMSGVVYGLFGYVWIRGQFDPGSGLYLHPNTVLMMIIWFFVCLVGWMGPIANTVHFAGSVTRDGLGILVELATILNRRTLPDCIVTDKTVSRGSRKALEVLQKTCGKSAGKHWLILGQER